MLLQVALNGSRTLADHPRVPLTPEQQAAAAAAAVAAGAGAIHVHVRGRDGKESLAPEEVALCLHAIRSECPGIPIGVSTGSWIVPDPDRRLALMQAWEVLPDFASVNVHEEGAEGVMGLLQEQGIGIEAGIWNARAAIRVRQSRFMQACLRLLIEPAEDGADATTALVAIERELRGVLVPRLLHGLDGSAWEMVTVAAQRGYDTRVGLEDTLFLPDGSLAADNAMLVAAARTLLHERE